MFSEKGTLLHIFKMHDNPNYPYLDIMTDNHDCVTHKYLLKKKDLPQTTLPVSQPR